MTIILVSGVASAQIIDIEVKTTVASYRPERDVATNGSGNAV